MLSLDFQTRIISLVSFLTKKGSKERSAPPLVIFRAGEEETEEVEASRVKDDILLATGELLAGESPSAAIW